MTRTAKLLAALIERADVQAALAAEPALLKEARSAVNAAGLDYATDLIAEVINALDDIEAPGPQTSRILADVIRAIETEQRTLLSLMIPR